MLTRDARVLLPLSEKISLMLVRKCMLGSFGAWASVSLNVVCLSECCSLRIYIILYCRSRDPIAQFMLQDDDELAHDVTYDNNCVRSHLRGSWQLCSPGKFYDTMPYATGEVALWHIPLFHCCSQKEMTVLHSVGLTWSAVSRSVLPC